MSSVVRSLILRSNADEIDRRGMMSSPRNTEKTNFSQCTAPDRLAQRHADRLVDTHTHIHTAPDRLAQRHTHTHIHTATDRLAHTHTYTHTYTVQYRLVDTHTHTHIHTALGCLFGLAVECKR